MYKFFTILIVILLAPSFALADGDHDHSDFAEVQTVPVSTKSDSGFMEAGGVRSGLGVDLEITPKNPTTGEVTIFDFLVNEKPKGTPVTDLQVEHEKFMHIIGVRNDLSQFFHIHPQENLDQEGLWTVDYVFENPGVYKVWTDIRRDNVTQSFGHKQISVSGEGTLDRAPIEFSENVIVENYQVALDLHNNLTAGENAEISLIVSDVFGRGVTLEPYLGADMHLAIIKNDLKAFIHAHPGTHVEEEEHADHSDESHEHSSFQLVNRALAHGEENNLDVAQLTFNAVFPEEGVYKLFAQFRPSEYELGEEEALVAEFYVNVGPAVPTSINTVSSDGDNFVGDGHTDHVHESVLKGPWYEDTRWWSLFLSSMVLMTLLSFGVHRFIRKEKKKV